MLVAWTIAGLLLGVALLPHAGIVVLSFAKVWSFSYVPARVTLDNYGEILLRTPHFVWDTLRYALLAAGIDVVLGAAIAWMLLRARLRGAALLDTLTTMPLAIPGVVLAIGFLRVFHGFDVPGLGGPLTATWLVPRIELGPLSYGIYIYMQSAVGRGPGAALGVVAILLVAVGTAVITRLSGRGTGSAFRL